MFDSSMLSGVTLLQLERYGEARGSTTEIYRKTGNAGLSMPQWNLIESLANSLRGMQVHRYRTDYICVASGEVVAGLYDLRPNSPTRALSCLLRLESDRPQALVIPTGVVHGFYFKSNTIYMQGMSEPWDGKDDFRCKWNDPELKLDWPTTNPVTSELDGNAASLADLRAQVEGFWDER